MDGQRKMRKVMITKGCENGWSQKGEKSDGHRRMRIFIVTKGRNFTRSRKVE